MSLHLSLGIDLSSSRPPFEQLRGQIATQVTSGELPAGTRLPTVRQLAAELGLAPNTVARAYRELESDGVVATHGRRGTVVRSAVLENSESSENALGDLKSGASSFVHNARRQGLTLPEAQALVERAWTQSSRPDRRAGDDRGPAPPGGATGLDVRSVLSGPAEWLAG